MRPNGKRDLEFVFVAWELIDALATGNRIDVKQIQLNQIRKVVGHAQHNFVFGKGW